MNYKNKKSIFINFSFFIIILSCVFTAVYAVYFSCLEKKEADSGEKNVPKVSENDYSDFFSGEYKSLLKASEVCVVNDDISYITDGDVNTLYLSELDELGRCGVCYGICGPDTITTGERGEIGHIKPSGWVQNKYPDIINSNPPYLYNRCHLLMWKAFGILDDERVLITGTRQFNAEYMLSVEMLLLNHIYDYNHDIKYRVTPVFTGDELVCRGVLMEALCTECDFGFNRYAPNLQNGIEIDYATGENWEK